MSDLVVFEYGSLDPETRIVVQQEDKEFDLNMGEASTSFVRACHNLKRIHEALKYKRPGFVEWQQTKSGLSEGTVRRMLAVTQMFSNLENISIASRSAIYLLADKNTPEPVRQEILQRAERGEVITHKEVKAVVSAHKEAKAEQKPVPVVVDEPEEEEQEEQEELRPYVAAPAPKEARKPQTEEPVEVKPRPKQIPTFPHSDQLVNWLDWLAGETHVINEEMGGIKALTAEPTKWNKKEVRSFIIPQLKDLRDTIDEFVREIEDAFQ